MFCQTCLNILQHNQLEEAYPYAALQNRYWHHKSTDSLLSSIRQKCQICIVIPDESIGFDDMSFYLRQAEIPGNPKPKLWTNFQFPIGPPPPSTGPRDSLAYFNLESYASLDGDSEEHFGCQECVMYKQSTLPADAIGKPLQGASTGSKEAMSTAVSWIELCNESHEQCNITRKPETSDWYPTRLLHVGNNHANTGTIRLLITSEVAPSGRYMTLSHCWGTSPPLKLLLENKESFVQGIEFDQLPRTFQDAVTTTRRCGIQYLWIDSLCIIQNDKKDWDVESLLMDQVYAGSYLNISADQGRDSSAGLFNIRDPIVDSLAPVHVHEEIYARGLGIYDRTRTSHDDQAPAHEKTLVLCQVPGSALDRLWTNCVDEAHLNTRGWVFQERYLSPRILHFGERQLLWECRQSLASEAYPLHRSEVSSKQLVLQDLEVELRRNFAWTDIVERYTCTTLTEPSDKLIAISGVAKHFQSEQGGDDEYLAGLWRRDLNRQLFWSTQHEPHRPSRYRAPSWSWASMEGHVGFWTAVQDIAPKDWCLQFEVLDARTTHTQNCDATGSVTGGYLDVRGYVGEGRVLKSHNDQEPRHFRLGMVVSADEYFLVSSPWHPLKDFSFNCDTPDDFPEDCGQQYCDDRTFYFLLGKTLTNFGGPTHFTSKASETNQDGEAEKYAGEDADQNTSEDQADKDENADGSDSDEFEWESADHILALILTPVVGRPGCYKRVGVSHKYYLLGTPGRTDVVKRLREVMADGGHDIPCLGYEDGLHTIRIL